MGKTKNRKKNKKKNNRDLPLAHGRSHLAFQPSRPSPPGGPPLSSSSPGPDAARWRACAGRLEHAPLDDALETPGPSPPSPSSSPSPSRLFRASPRSSSRRRRAPAWPTASAHQATVSRRSGVLDSFKLRDESNRGTPQASPVSSSCRRPLTTSKSNS